MKVFRGLSFLMLIFLVSCQKELPLPEPGPQYDPRNISRTDSTQSSGPSITIGPDGTVYVAWMDGGETQYSPSRIYFRYKPEGGDWSDIEILSDSLHDAWAPHIAADPFGNVHLVWWAYIPGNNTSHIYYRMRYPSGEWSETEVISGEESADQCRIAVDSSGTVHVIWIHGFWMKYRSRAVNGSWSEIETVPVGRQGAVNPNMNVDANGGVHIVYEADRDIKYLYRSSTSGWGEPANVTQSSYKSWYGEIFLDENGRPWIFWTEQDYRAGWNTGIIYYTYLEDEGWTEPDTIPGTVGWPRDKYVAFQYGDLLLAWVDGRSRLNIPVQFIIRRNGEWGEVNEMDFPLWAWNLRGARGPGGIIHLVWQSEIQIDEIHYQYDIFYDTIEF